MNKAIVLPDGRQVPATPGKYRIVSPPDLNELVEMRFLLEYDFPFLIVRAMVKRPASGAEQLEASTQAGIWRHQYPSVGGFIAGPLNGYKFNEPSSRHPSSRGFLRQFIPDISYIDARTWSRLTPKEKRMGFVPCVPAVVIELMSETDKIKNLQDKVTKFINAGSREGVIVDTRRDRVWIYNRNQQPYFDSLAPIEFDSWPGFTLDCIAIRDARTQAGLT
jgi:hypothetical protein